jgi:hypothetical protein
MKTARQIYCQYLLSSQINYTCTNMAEHIDGLDHNSIYRFLEKKKMIPSSRVREGETSACAIQRWLLALFDDTVLDKPYSSEISGVRRQYSGNAHGIIKGRSQRNHNLCEHFGPGVSQEPGIPETANGLSTQ